MENKNFDIKFEKIAVENLKDILEIIGKNKLEKIIQGNKKDIKNEPLINGFRLGHMDLNLIIDIFYSQIKLKNQNLLKEIIKEIIQSIFIETEKEILNLEKNKNFEDNFYKIIIESPFVENISLYLKFSDEKYDKNIEKNYKEYRQKLKEKELYLNLEEKRKEVKLKDKKIKEIEKEHKSKIAKLEKDIKTLNDSLEKNKENLEFLKIKNIELESDNKKIKEENKSLNKKVLKTQINVDIKNLEEKKSNLEKTLKFLKDQEIEVKQEIEILKKDEDKLIEDLELKENKKDDLLRKERELKIENNRLKESIDTLNLEMGNFLDKFNSVFKNNTKNKKDDSLDEVLVYQVEDNYNIKLSDEELSDEIRNKKNLIEDFMYDFSDNLENVGLKYDNVWLARYIYSILSSEEIPLFVGYSAVDISNALSNTVCSKNADIINIPMGFNNSKELINIVENCESEVVVINNILKIKYAKIFNLLNIIFKNENDKTFEYFSKFTSKFLLGDENE
ncbi:hypothetical protein [Fusobacterium sp. IOR10]|uniref:hypothetical protein n=1 Tax=Fusobacterium sp. IOR10 TaxID=2665157 RepID=UPI0013D8D02C|nr:hypothetical protein [Fusobacterium sp. IOR10]